MGRMKLVIVFMLVIFTTSSTIAAEITSKGFKLGVNMSKFIGDDADMNGLADNKYQPGFTLGGFAVFGGKNNWSFRPEILYTSRGNYAEADYIFFGAAISERVEVNINYIDVPLLAVYSNHARISFFGGPYLGLFLSGKAKYEVDAIPSFDIEASSEERDIESDEISTVDFGLVFGATFLINQSISFELRYAHGLKTIDKKPDDWNRIEDGPFDLSDVRHSALQVMLTISL